MSSSISAGVNVNINRPTAGFFPSSVLSITHLVSSQLHTPLNVKGSIQTDSAVGAMAAVKRETNIVDPLSRIVDPVTNSEGDLSRLYSLEKQNPDLPQPKAKTLGEILLMKIRLFKISNNHCLTFLAFHLSI
jgi:hypothetical protein